MPEDNKEASLINKDLWQVRNELEEVRRENEKLRRTRGGGGNTEQDQKKIQELSKNLELLQKEKWQLENKLKLAEHENLRTTQELQDERTKFSQESHKLLKQLEKTKSAKATNSDLGEVSEGMRQVMQQGQQLSQELEHAHERNRFLSKKVDLLFEEMRLMNEQNQQQLASINSKTAQTAPTGKVILVMTRVFGAASMWETDPEAMSKAARLYTSGIRELAAKFNAYEASAESVAFVFAFADPAQAVSFALQLQLDTMEIQWPSALLTMEECAVEERDSIIIFRGFRVQIAMHIGEVETEENPSTGRTSYLGTIPNRTTKLANCTQGGQIVASKELWDTVASVEWEVTVPFESQLLGGFKLRENEDETHIVQVLPAALKLRRFAPFDPANDYSSPSMSQQIEKLKQEKEELQNKISQAEGAVKNMKEHTAHLMTQLTTLCEDQPTFSQELFTSLLEESRQLAVNQRELENNFRNIDDQNSELKKKYEDMMKDDKTKKIQDLEAKLEKSRKASYQAQNELNEHRRQAEENSRLLGEKNTQLLQQNEMLQKQNNDLQKNRNDLDDQNKELKEKNHELSLKSQEQLTLISESKQTKQLEREKHKLTKQTKKLEKEKRSLSKTAQQLEEENKRLKHFEEKNYQLAQNTKHLSEKLDLQTKKLEEAQQVACTRVGTSWVAMALVPFVGK